ncbi:MAG: DUF368 domain-containing protein [Lachnospiraceae bacterium]
MFKNGFQGFCMALTDSVPGVSGGTIAFIMGFYEQFIGAIHDLAFGKANARKAAVKYLVRLGVGWVIGMALAVVVLSASFEKHIYMVSSLFIGLIAGSIPLIVREERENFSKVGKGICFCVLGLVLVAGITWINENGSGISVDLGQLSLSMAMKLFGMGMIAICAMFLPGISGSTLLLILGAYFPVIMAVRRVLAMEPAYLPGLCLFGCGAVTGVLSIVKAIQICLERYRSQMLYFILGMMLGSFYAIIMGPTTLEIPQPSLDIHNVHLWAVAAGVVLVLGMQRIKDKSAANRNSTEEDSIC